jgi:serine/threonine-protein kinase
MLHLVSSFPSRIGRYDLVTALATSAIARTFLARTGGIGGFDCKVVIKILELPPGPDSDAATAMFLDEARLLGLLHHQHIASVFDVGVDDEGRPYMVLEHLEGVAAHDVLQRATEHGAVLPIDFALTVVSAVANGLHHAHTRNTSDGEPLGIVHREVAPSSVMIGFDGAVKIRDFGVAMASVRTTTTQIGFVKGKVGYLSPEQIAGRGVDARTDVFGLGLLLYELTTQHPAFRSSSDLKTMQRIKAGKLVPPSQLVSNYPRELEAIVMKALKVDPRDRFPTADALRRAVVALGHRLHLVLGDAAIIEVMSQLFEARAAAPSTPAEPQQASPVPDPALDWLDSERMLTTVRGESQASDPALSNRPPSDPLPSDPPLRQPRAVSPAAPNFETPVVGLPIDRPVILLPRAPARMQSARALRWIAAATATVLGGLGYLAMHQSTPAIAGSASSPLATPLVVEPMPQEPQEPPTASPPAASAPAASAATASASVQSDPPPVPPPAPTFPSPPVAPTEIRLQIVSHPSDATVLLDGKRLGHTPFNEIVAADPGKHVIKLRHKGYESQRIERTLDADITEDVALVPSRDRERDRDHERDRERDRDRERQSQSRCQAATRGT